MEIINGHVVFTVAERLAIQIDAIKGFTNRNINIGISVPGVSPLGGLDRRDFVPDEANQVKDIVELMSRKSST